jgi:hypothetical protein
VHEVARRNRALERHTWRAAWAHGGHRDRIMHFKQGTSAAIGMQESSLNPWAIGAPNSNGTRDFGMFGNSANLEKLAPEFRRIHGHDPDWQDCR